jgi:hypothetical protein
MTDADPTDLPRLGKCRCMDPSNLEDILKAGREILQRRSGNSTKTEDRRFWEIFGCRPLVALSLWNLIMTESTMQPLHLKESIQHMLWALMFLKTYVKECTLSMMAGGVDEKTWQAWFWPMIQAISDLEHITVSPNECHLIFALTTLG